MTGSTVARNDAAIALCVSLDRREALEEEVTRDTGMFDAAIVMLRQHVIDHPRLEIVTKETAKERARLVAERLLGHPLPCA